MKKAPKVKAGQFPKVLALEIRGGRYHLVADGKSVSDSVHKYYVTGKKNLYMGPNTQYIDNTKGDKALAGQSSLDAAAIDNPALAFDIDQRFEFLGQLIQMVAEGKTPSAIVTGPGGLGKTHEVLEALKKAGRKDLDYTPMGTQNGKGYFRMIKGFSTVKGLYDSLFENKDGMLVLDDCDSAFDDDDAANLLKGALDTYSKRRISWNKSRSSFGDDDKIPQSFDFNGQVIIISNLSQTKMSQAVRTRAMCVDVSMTVDQMITRMKFIMKEPLFMENVSSECKEDAMKLIEELKDNIKNLSLRSLILATKIRVAKGKDEWKKLASYMLLSQA